MWIATYRVRVDTGTHEEQPARSSFARTLAPEGTHTTTSPNLLCACSRKRSQLLELIRGRIQPIMNDSRQNIEIAAAKWQLPPANDDSPNARAQKSTSLHAGTSAWMVLCLALLAGEIFLVAGYAPSGIILSQRMPARQRGLLAAFVERDEQISKAKTKHRFANSASTKTEMDEPCILSIGKAQYDLSPWAKAHPGGADVLKRFHGKNATLAFEAVGHSKKAYELLHKFKVGHAVASVNGDKGASSRPASRSVVSSSTANTRQVPLWRKKLFTHEDPIGIHKYLGIFVLLHFAFRYSQLLFGDPSAGFGNRMGQGPSGTAALWLVPHAILNLSAFLFHTVPRERVVGKPMIWKEYRVHNLIFAMRSIVSAFFCWVSVYFQHSQPWRRLAVVGCSLAVLSANWGADEATRRLRPSEYDSSIASLPFWDGCSADRQRRIKKFYAYCQFMATIACLMVSNPAWPFAVLMPIQMSSILLTLVRKGLISARGFHIGYVASLVLPFFMGLRHFLIMRTVDIPAAFLCGTGIFYLRSRGVNKYVLWGPTAALRIVVGDRLMNWDFLW